MLAFQNDYREVVPKVLTNIIANNKVSISYVIIANEMTFNLCLTLIR